jgi:hypothetical protein
LKKNNRSQPVLTELSDLLRTPRANQKSPARAAGTPPFSKKCPAVGVHVPLPDAISPEPPEEPRYLSAILPRNVRAKIVRRKTQLPVVETPDPPEIRPARIVRSSPLRKRSLPKSLSPSSSTVALALPFHQPIGSTEFNLCSYDLTLCGQDIRSRTTISKRHVSSKAAKCAASEAAFP